MKLIVIGSGNNTHLKLDSQFVSSYHAELLLLDNGELLLTDKGSKNGTYLNDQRLQPNKDIPIKRGDNIRFADQVLDWKNVPSLPMPDLAKIKEMRGIGTNFRNKYQLQGEKVSRFHATFKKKNDKKWYIQDHSKNGTTVNGQSIPSNQDVKLKKGDKILCAGVPVPNPYGEGVTINYRKIFVTFSIVLLLCGGIYGIVRWIQIPGKAIVNPLSLKPIPDEEIYAKYRNSTVLLLGFYYYKVSAGNLDLKKDCGLPTEVVMLNGKLQAVNGQRSNMNSFTGTGFFISEDGKIVTNLHIVRPWLFEKEKTLISDQYKMFIANAASEIPALNAYTAQVKVEGVLSYIGMVPNGAYFSEENLKQCRELIAHDDINKDVAILQLESKKLPTENSSMVDLNQAIVDDSAIRVGSHIYTMGFPFGLNLQDLRSSRGVQILANGGSITQECTEYSFGFNAPSYGGASGSPIFNDRGQLIGVLNSGVTKSQGFNRAIKAVHVKDLLNNSLQK
ncbi:FHA domain-containing protein [Parabacteroides pacaensis]|uniref:FHA domain-containing protein n=1 Tax=Parabacteroides pacaensis TaxID=2086575 RepID=UPI000D0F9F4C|nr:FHA domain-containing protein [Parabacteroides pacaensis]